jgi:hypothetical protein
LMHCTAMDPGRNSFAALQQNATRSDFDNLLLARFGLHQPPLHQKG